GGIQFYPGGGVVFLVHLLQQPADALQVFGGAPGGCQGGGGDLDMGTGLKQVVGGEIAQLQFAGGPVRNNKGAAPGLGAGQAQGRAGAQCFADHRAADPVVGGEGCFGTQFAPERDFLGFNG